MTRGKKNISELRTFWEKQHELQNILYLSDYSLEQVVGYLGIDDYLKDGIRVLDIGVGTGREIRDLNDSYDLDIYAIDITEAALFSVEKVVSGYWFFDELDEVTEDFFDLAICQLVAQHNTDENLTTLLIPIIASLKETGVLAIQFGSPLEEETEDYVQDDSMESQIAGTVLRTKAEMSRIVHRAGGEIFHVRKSVDYPESHIQWNAFHIRRR
jgi:SAM-dependent methyltransferase